MLTKDFCILDLSYRLSLPGELPGGLRDDSVARGAAGPASDGDSDVAGPVAGPAGTVVQAGDSLPCGKVWAT